MSYIVSRRYWMGLEYSFHVPSTPRCSHLYPSVTGMYCLSRQAASASVPGGGTSSGSSENSSACFQCRGSLRGSIWISAGVATSVPVPSASSTRYRRVGSVFSLTASTTYAIFPPWIARLPPSVRARRTPRPTARSRSKANATARRRLAAGSGPGRFQTPPSRKFSTPVRRFVQIFIPRYSASVRARSFPHERSTKAQKESTIDAAGTQLRL
mmetsp:Transcript_5952/g.12459  ORF Transcript_5952/g.12459 Transcript_5952/m.12459 type:complete len:212 (+) Transcript_5952:1002-1637(+)